MQHYVRLCACAMHKCPNNIAARRALFTCKKVGGANQGHVYYASDRFLERGASHDIYRRANLAENVNRATILYWRLTQWQFRSRSGSYCEFDNF